MKTFHKDVNGNIFSGISSVLILSFIIIFIILLNLNNYLLNENNDILAGDNIKYIVDDYSRNIESLAYSSLEEISENTINLRNPLENSPKEIKKVLNEKLDNQNREYYDKFNVKISSEVISIENTDKPENLLIKTSLNIEKEDKKFNDIIESKVSILNLKDPLPILLCGNHPSFSYNESKINYGESLSNYLKSRNLDNFESYINASSPIILKKCPYDPYVHHGDNHILHDCINKGYYHESADGSCYLCRLEGRPLCPHYGFETFIVPKTNINNNLTSISSSDHVVFSDNYPGNQYSYYNDSNINKIIFIDSSHKRKYGL